MTRFAIIFIVICLLSVTGCVSYESLLNFSETDKSKVTTQQITNFEPLVIQPDDVLRIRLSSPEASALNPFRMNAGQGEGSGTSSEEYLVNNEGYIEFPTIKSIKVGGLLLEEIKVKLLEELGKYFSEEPIIQVRLINFRINVNGEVNSPGSFIVNSNRISVYEAITLAGDFSPYSRRDSIMIIRETNGEREFGYVDFNSLDVFESPYFYLQQNDMIYIQPSKPKVATIQDPASRALPYVSGFISIIAIVLAVFRTF